VAGWLGWVGLSCRLADWLIGRASTLQKGELLVAIPVMPLQRFKRLQA